MEEKIATSLWRKDNRVNRKSHGKAVRWNGMPGSIRLRKADRGDNARPEICKKQENHTATRQETQGMSDE